MNSHHTNSVSDVHIYFKVSSRKTRLSLFPTSFTVEAIPIENIPPRGNERTIIKDNTGNAMLNLNDVLAVKFPDMLLLSDDKMFQMRKVDGTPGKELPMSQEYYKVNNVRRLNVKVIVTYKPDIYKGRQKTETYHYIIMPVFEQDDKFKSLTNRHITQI